MRIGMADAAERRYQDQLLDQSLRAEVLSCGQWVSWLCVSGGVSLVLPIGGLVESVMGGCEELALGSSVLVAGEFVSEEGWSLLSKLLSS